MKQYRNIPIITKFQNKYNNHTKINLKESLTIDFIRLMEHAIKKHISITEKNNLLRLNLYKLFKIYRSVNGYDYSKKQYPLIYHLIKTAITKYPSKQFNNFKYSEQLINGSKIITASYTEHLQQLRVEKKRENKIKKCISIFEPYPIPITWEELKIYTNHRIFEEKHNLD